MHHGHHRPAVTGADGADATSAGRSRIGRSCSSGWRTTSATSSRSSRTSPIVIAHLRDSSDAQRGSSDVPSG